MASSLEPSSTCTTCLPNVPPTKVSSSLCAAASVKSTTSAYVGCAATRRASLGCVCVCVCVLQLTPVPVLGSSWWHRILPSLLAQVYDLLNPSSTTLPVRWNKQHGFFVQGLLVLDCSTLEDIMAIVSEGHRNRRTGSHELNLDSSRSHSILSINVDAERIDPDDGHSVVTHGKMLFVDLAGAWGATREGLLPLLRVIPVNDNVAACAHPQVVSVSRSQRVPAVRLWKLGTSTAACSSWCAYGVVVVSFLGCVGSAWGCFMPTRHVLVLRV